MRRIALRMGAALIILLAASLNRGTFSAFAQSGGGYDLTWNSIDGGGSLLSTGGTYSLDGTIGQPDAGTMSGGSYSLGGGFWGGGTLAPDSGKFKVYLPLVLK